MTAPASKIWYPVSCHCRATSFKILLAPLESQQQQVMSCNCSICTKNGYLTVYPRRQDGELEWLGGYDRLKAYTFGKAAYAHKFCPECGSSMLCEEIGKGEEGGLAVNARMIQGIDLDKLNLVRYDGWNKLQPQYEG